MTPAISQYAPSFRIVVKNKNVELQHGSTVDVLSLSVTETFNRADTFMFVVRDRHPDPNRLFAGGDALRWMDSDVFDECNEIEIHMGYVGNLHPLFLGEITAVSTSFPASGQPTLTVQGQSLYHRLHRARRRRPFDPGTDSDIAEEIGSDLEMGVEADDTESEHALVSSDGGTIGSLLRRRARRLNYEVTVKDRTLYFQRPRYLDNPSAALTLEWGKDLISFSPRLSTHNLPTEVTVRGCQTSRERGKEPIVGTARVGDERVSLGDRTGQQVVQQAFGDSHLLVEDHDVASPQEATEMARARLEAEGMRYIVGEGACVGNPELRSRTVIELRGLGERFSGLYYVTSTTHRINGSGYLTDFSVERNGR